MTKAPNLEGFYPCKLGDTQTCPLCLKTLTLCYMVDQKKHVWKHETWDGLCPKGSK